MDELELRLINFIAIMAAYDLPATLDISWSESFLERELTRHQEDVGAS